jgi:hypothetical protein
MFDTLHYADFTPHLNTPFHLRLGEEVLELKLIQVEEYNSTPQQERFALFFRAPQTAPAEQAIYQLEHAQLGSGSLFLVPIGRDAEGLQYEATFNRQSKA